MYISHNMCNPCLLVAGKPVSLYVHELKIGAAAARKKFSKKSIFLLTHFVEEKNTFAYGNNSKSKRSRRRQDIIS